MPRDPFAALRMTATTLAIYSLEQPLQPGIAPNACSLAPKGRLVGGPSFLIGSGFRFLWNGLRFGVGLVVDEVLLSVRDFSAGKGGVAPALDFDALAFEVLIDGEEVGDLAEHVGVDFGEVPDVLVARVVFADAEDLLVSEALVEHLQNADGADLHDAAGKAGSVDEDKDVEGVAVVGEGAGDEAVVSGIVDGGVEIAVETEDVEFLVILVLVAALVGDFDDNVDDLGAVRPYGEFQVIRHKSEISSLCNFAVAGVMPVVASGIPGWPCSRERAKRHLVYNQTG
jgi:hypothetical protein